MSALTELAERLEKATGSSRELRELDAAVWFAFFKPDYVFPAPVLNRVPSDLIEAYERFHWDGGGGYSVTVPLPRYLSSLDAAIALCERKGYSVYAWEDRRWFLRKIKAGRGGVQYGGTAHDSMALGLCLALVEAEMREDCYDWAMIQLGKGGRA